MELFRNRVCKNFTISKNQKNPYLLKERNGSREFLVLLKCITSAHFKNKDITRIQVDKRKLFSDVLNKSHDIVPIGYDVQNNIYVIWNPHNFK